MYLGDLPGLIYDPQKGKYFKKLSTSQKSPVTKFVHWNQKPIPNYSPISSIVHNQIFDKTFDHSNATILENLPLPKSVRLPYLKLFVHFYLLFYHRVLK